jgi:sulfate permease, SulP family
LRLPLFRSLVPYDRQWLRGDVVAGLTVWAVLVPEALAYASIAGVSPVVGLYAAPGALIFYAAFGSSRHLIVGPMSATAALSAAAIAEFAAASSDRFTQLTIALAITTGVVAALAGLLRLGFLANYISEPVLKGFIIGLALTIIAGQLPKLFGVEKGSGDFFEKIWDLLTKLGDTSGLTLLVGLASLAVLFVLRRVAPVVPASLVAVVFGVVVVKLFDLDHHGVAIVGHIDRGLPSIGLPDVQFRDYLHLAGPAVGVMLVGFAEGLGAAKTYGTREHYEVDANRELLGVGAANLAAGLSSGMVVNGSLSKTAVNGSAGARTQLSGLTVAALTIVTLLFLTGLFEDLPEATLAAVVIAAVIELVDIAGLRRLYQVFTGPVGRRFGLAIRPDFVAAVAALLGVLVVDTLPGLFIGIAVSFLLLVYRASTPHIATLGRVPGDPSRYTDIRRNPDNESIPGVLILRPESGLFFANADYIRRSVLTRVTEADPRVVVLDAETMPYVDVTAVTMLGDLAEALRERGVTFVVARNIDAVGDVVRRAEAGDEIHIYPTCKRPSRRSPPIRRASSALGSLLHFRHETTAGLHVGRAPACGAGARGMRRQQPVAGGEVGGQRLHEHRRLAPSAVDHYE